MYTSFTLQTSVQQYESAVFPHFLEGFPLQMFKSASNAPSFVVVVSCYYSCGSILNFFELILKGPKQNCYIPGPDAPVLCMLPLLRLEVLSQEVEAPIMLCLCFTTLRHILGHFGSGQLPYPHCSWASLLGSLPKLSAHSFASS